MPKPTESGKRNEIVLTVGVRSFFECSECSYPRNGESLEYKGGTFCRPECALIYHGLDPKIKAVIKYPEEAFPDPFGERGVASPGLPYGRPDRFLRRPQPVFSEKGYRSGDRGSDDAGPDAERHSGEGLVLE